MKHFVPFPGASPFLTATVLRPPSGQLPPPQYVYPVAYGGPVFGQRGCRRALLRAGRESGEHGSRGLWRMQWLWPDGPQEGGVSMHAERAAGTTACRIGTGPQRTGSLRSLLCARMVEAKKACAPFWDTGRKSRLVKGSLRGKPSRIDSRDATGWRPQAVPVSEKDASRDHRQQGGALKVSAVGDTGPTDIAGRMRGSLSSSKAGCPGRYALRGRPARWAKPMRAWVSLAAVKSA